MTDAGHEFSDSPTFKAVICQVEGCTGEVKTDTRPPYLCCPEHWAKVTQETKEGFSTVNGGDWYQHARKALQEAVRDVE